MPGKALEFCFTLINFTGALEITLVFNSSQSGYLILRSSRRNQDAKMVL